jgi:hypothetical protein
MVGEVGDFQIVMNLPVTTVPVCIGSNAHTLQHLQFPDMGASGGPLDGTCIVHNGTDELHIQQNTIRDGESASPEERSLRSQPLRRFLSHLIDMFRPGEPLIKSKPKLTGVFDPLDWIPEKLNRSGFRDVPAGLGRRASRSS